MNLKSDLCWSFRTKLNSLLTSSSVIGQEENFISTSHPYHWTPGLKNYTGLTYSCPRDWRLFFIMRTQLRTSLKLPVHDSTIVLRDLRGNSYLGPHYVDRRRYLGQRMWDFPLWLLPWNYVCLESYFKENFQGKIYMENPITALELQVIRIGTAWAPIFGLPYFYDFFRVKFLKISAQIGEFNGVHLLDRPYP